MSASHASVANGNVLDAMGSDAFERRPLDWRTLADGEPPQRDWAIDHWLGMAYVTLLAGLGGIGKTLLAQMLGSALALGRPFIDAIHKPRTVLAWWTEDDHDEIWRRQVAIAAHFGVGLEQFAGRFIVESFADRDAMLLDLDLGGRLVKTAMYDELREQANDYRADVIMLDNAARLFGGKEADRGQVTRFIAALNAVKPSAAKLLLAHPGRAIGSEYSGSSAWDGASRMRLYMSDRPPDAHMFEAEQDAPSGDRRYLSKRKTNYSARDLRTFRYESGVLMPEQAASESGGVVDAITSRRDERIVLDGFKQLINGLNQQPTDGDNSPNFLPALILKFNLADGRTKRDLSQAMRRLMVNGTLKREPIGKYGNRNPRFGLVMASAVNA
jgi:AAA domain-containing protein